MFGSMVQHVLSIINGEAIQLPVYHTAFQSKHNIHPPHLQRRRLRTRARRLLLRLRHLLRGISGRGAQLSKLLLHLPLRRLRRTLPLLRRF